MISRTLSLQGYKESLFLFGPRQVGKTTLLKNTLSPALYINLLLQKEYLRYANDPSLLRKEIAALTDSKVRIVIDEIQRCPSLLNEIHALIEEHPGLQFILSGSSARKLRKGGVNLLGGRAITKRLHPLTHEEIGKIFSLESVLHFGSLPKVVLEEDPKSRIRFLQSYVETYLKEEIQQEALTRNIPAFSRFLELAAFENGSLLSFNNISREVGVEGKTIKEYFQILEDTLLGFFLYPFTRSHRERLVSHPKFYFFDPGIVRSLKSELSAQLIPASPPYGYAFEHWLLLEIRKLLDYREREYKLSFFRTTDGTEVDLILEIQQEIWAIEIKASAQPCSSDIRGLKSFIEDHKYQRALCPCLTPRRYKDGKIEILPWQEFLKEL